MRLERWSESTPAPTHGKVLTEWKEDVNLKLYRGKTQQLKSKVNISFVRVKYINRLRWLRKGRGTLKGRGHCQLVTRSANRLRVSVATAHPPFQRHTSSGIETVYEIDATHDIPGEKKKNGRFLEVQKSESLGSPVDSQNA